MTEVRFYVELVRGGYIILLGLALSEAFKQFVPDSDQPIRWARFPSLLSFLFLILPFMHGMSRYLYWTYLKAATTPEHFSMRLSIDAATFMLMAAFFFVMSRSLSSSHWRRLYCALLLLLVTDSCWVIFVIHFGAPLKEWLILNTALVALLLVMFAIVRRADSIWPPIICAIATLITGVISYIGTYQFFFAE